MPYDGFSQKPQIVASNNIYKNLVVTDGRYVHPFCRPPLSFTQLFALSTAIQCKTSTNILIINPTRCTNF